jgi:hypothetical protein
MQQEEEARQKAWEEHLQKIEMAKNNLSEMSMIELRQTGYWTVNKREDWQKKLTRSKLLNLELHSSNLICWHHNSSKGILDRQATTPVGLHSRNLGRNQCLIILEVHHLVVR